jgi:nucleoid DNA-binding protein
LKQEIRQQLKFRPDGSFKIIQITDIQDSVNISTDTIKFIDAVLEKEKPDLVVFTGDQIMGYSPSLRKADAREKVKYVIDSIIAPLTKHNTLFTITFGNHDVDSKVPLKEQLKFYQGHEQCMAYDVEGLPGCANHNLTIQNSSGDGIAFNLYLIDSLGSKSLSEYEAVTAQQVNWYRRTRDDLKAKNNGKYLPSLVFQHIPVEEVFNLLKEVKKGTKGSMPAHRKRKGKFYILNRDIVNKDAFWGEMPCAPEDNFGEFEAMSECGDVIGIYFGHDHKNCFYGNYNGVDLGYTPGCGFSAYGPRFMRGIRVFELNEADPKHYKTITLHYVDFFGKKVAKPLKCYLTDIMPASLEDAVAKIKKLLLVIAVAAAIIVLIVKFII